jgi:tRNA (Thr-GGU) A37 N-methylase
VNELLSESKSVLERIQSLNDGLDGLEEGSIVLIENQST